MENFDIIYIGQLLQALILATVPVLAGMAARWLIARANVEKAKLSAEQTQALDLFIKTAVYAAEQMHAKKFVADRLQYATEQTQKWLDAHGLIISAEEIRLRIEAAVKTELNNKK